MKIKNKIVFAAILSLSAAVFFSAGLNHGVAQTYSGPRDGCWCGTGASQFPGYNPNAKVTYTSEAECTRKGGRCFSSRSEAYSYVHTVQRRRPTTCWCYVPIECFTTPCPPGTVTQTSQSECQRRGGHCFTSQAEALRYRDRSRPTTHRTGWCCIYRNGHHSVIQTTWEECQANGGNCYHNRYDAYRDCSPPGAVF